MGGQVMVDAGKGVLTPPKKVQNRTNVIQKRIENNHNNMLNGNGSSGSESGSTSPAKSSLRHVRKHDAMTQPPITNSFKIPKINKSEGPGTSKSFKVDVAKLSKEDEALMQKSLKEFKVGGSRETSYNNFSPRARKKEQSKYKERSDSESSEDEEGNPKMKSKFFKHTEKERNDEKQKHKEEKRRRGRRGSEDDAYNP